MNTKHPPTYAVVDRRRDGGQRIVAEYSDPKAARDAAVLMRWAGTPAEVVLISALRDDEGATALLTDSTGAASNVPAGKLG